MTATNLTRSNYPNYVNTSPFYGVKLRNFAIKGLFSMFVLMVLIIYLLPFGNMMILSLRDQESLSQTADAPVLPMKPLTFEFQGKQLPVVQVPQEDGSIKEMAILTKRRNSSDLIDPANPNAEPIRWEGRWQTLEPVYNLHLHWANYPEAWEKVNFPRLFFNTVLIAVVGMVGTLLSCISVAYAFARFPIPGKNILFIILIGTIILPSQVTLVPTYAFFSTIGWTKGAAGLLPLIVPHFFANAYNVFLLRQFFMTLSRELDEAAMIDGAGPFQILTRIIIPQAWPAIVTVGLFHFVWSWNDYFGPLIYLLGSPEWQPISVGVQIFNFRYGPRPELVQATSLMAMVLPLLLFLFAQRYFMRGVVITGVEK